MFSRVTTLLPLDTSLVYFTNFVYTAFSRDRALDPSSENAGFSRNRSLRTDNLAMVEGLRRYKLTKKQQNCPLTLTIGIVTISIVRSVHESCMYNSQHGHRILHRSPSPLLFASALFIMIRHSASTVNRSSHPPGRAPFLVFPGGTASVYGTC